MEQSLPIQKKCMSCPALVWEKKWHAFKKEGDYNYLRKELEAPFPKLKAADRKFLLHWTLGGGSGKRSLHKIPLGPQGYTIKWLQENKIAIGAACIYVVSFEGLAKEEASQECKVNVFEYFLTLLLAISVTAFVVFQPENNNNCLLFLYANCHLLCMPWRGTIKYIWRPQVWGL